MLGEYEIIRIYTKIVFSESLIHTFQVWKNRVIQKLALELGKDKITKGIP